MLPLPAEPFSCAERRHANVNIDYHVEADRHYYSVACRFVHERLEVRITATTTEVSRKGQRLTSHRRGHKPGDSAHENR